MDTLIKEKIKQAIGILDEFEIDVWLTFVRETTAGDNKVLPLIYGYDLTWQSAIILCRNGEKISIIGHFEAETAKSTGLFTKIIPYHQSIRDHLIDSLSELNPGTIAINYSMDDVLADEISVGMHQLLLKYLKGTQWLEKLISSERIIRALRGRKTKTEIDRVKNAIAVTNDIYEKTFNYIQPGLTEIEVSQFMHNEIEIRKVIPAWDHAHCPTVNAGPNSPIGHVLPTDLIISKGQIIHLDFGVKLDDYCSDIQRVIYILAEDEIEPPAAVQHGFKTIVNAIQRTVNTIKPGMMGNEIDQITRKHIIEAGYPEYMYATGHQLGRLAHDGAGIIGPLWERYGDTPRYLVEPGQIYTIEPGIMIPNYGYCGLEEDILITNDGAIFLGKPQTELMVK